MLEFGIGLFIGATLTAMAFGLWSGKAYDKGYQDALRKVLRVEAEKLESEPPRG